MVEGTRGSPSTTALGVLTDRDLVVRGMATGLDPATTTVEEVYTHETVYAYENDLARDALDVMRRRNVGRLLVADRGDALVGVVSFARIAGFTGDVAFDGPVDLRNAESAPKVDADTAGPSR
ncbi:MAG: CBS domain-containing protein [Asticcacaulis sp.]|nr:CBS domain-containing protein [Asticcacaulis sp.]